MGEELIKLETAKLAKDKGFIFDADLDDYIENGGLMFFGKNYWDHDRIIPLNLLFWHTSPNTAQWMDLDIHCPTQAHLQRWLREQRTPIIVTATTDFVAWEVQIQHPDKGLFTITKNTEDRWFNSYEEAMEAGLLEALKLI